MTDGKAEVIRFARRCAWAYRISSFMVAVLYGGVAIAGLLLFREAMGALRVKSDLFNVLLVVTPLAAFIISQFTAHKVRRQQLMYLRRHIRANLFRRGLWEKMLEMTTDHRLILKRLYRHYPQLCAHLDLEPYSAEYRNLIHPDEPRFVLSHLYAAQLWRLALGEAVMQELGPRTPGRRFS